VNILEQNYKIDKIYFAIPSLENKEILKNIKKICSKYDKQLFIIPSIVDIIGSNVKIDLIREVNIEDLLFRPIKKYNVDRIKEFIKGKNILIT
jgi:FlaA1/EpsC-like NDP-sugar epimerase